MKIEDFKVVEKDKVEITKQQQEEIQTIFDSRITPHENHTLFEYNLNTRAIILATFQPEVKDILWSDAVNGNFKKLNKKVLKNEGCLYISALNKENCIKILKRDFNL
jgi:hypothetical protein